MISVVRSYPDRDTEQRWRQFLASVSWASHHASPEYFLEPKVRDKRPFAVLAECDDRIVGCVTGRHEEAEVVCGQPTHPQLLGLDRPDRDAVDAALARALLEEAHQSSSVVVYSWTQSSAFAEARFRVRQCNATYVLDLSVDEDTLSRQLDGKRRNGIHAALRRGLEVREAGADDLPRFYEVLQATHRRLGLSSPLPMHDLLVPARNRKLFVAYHGGRCVAGTILRFHQGGLAEYSENASLPEFWQLRPNDLLLWRGILWAKRAGCRALNFAGYNAFKKEFGGRLHPVFQLRLDNSFLRLRDQRESLELSARRLYRIVRTKILSR
jgi:hypothetical protein